MKAPALFLAAVSLWLPTSSCGGSPCGGADTGGPNPAYVGTFTGTYTNTRTFGGSGTARNLTFAFTLNLVGHVTGTVTEPDTQRTVELAGSIFDIDYACSEDKTFCDLTFTFDGEERRILAGSRSKDLSQPWPFAIDRYDLGNERIGSGSLALTKE